LLISHFASNFTLKSSTIKKISKNRKFLYIRPWTSLSRVVAERIPRITIPREVYLDIISYEDWARHYQLTFWWRRDAALLQTCMKTLHTGVAPWDQLHLQHAQTASNIWQNAESAG
jgi:hypothetical protein